jgi:photosystem II stability/assembly factor-like uncharacterized protein
MKHFLAIFLILSSFSLTIAQTIDTANYPIWVDMMDDPESNFFETQKAFNRYFENRERQPGDGWKVFKRWENLYQDKINTDGSIPDQAAISEAFYQWQIAYNQSNTNGVESENGAWEEIGPIPKPENGTGQPNGNGRLNTICFHPTNSDILWVGAPAGGLWKSTDGGDTWSSNTDELATLGVSSILVDPTNTSVMYMGTGDRDAGDAPGLGVYKSTNGGSTWTQSNSGMGNKEVGAMVMHPANSSYILAATSGGVYRSQNGGSSWTLESNTSFFKDIKYQPGNPNVVYATETSSTAGFYRSTDGGDTWAEITSGLPTNPQRYVIGVSEADSTVVYLLCSISSAYGGLFKSTDGGLTFSTQSTTPNIMGWAENGTSSGGQGWYDLAIEVDPTNASVVYAGGVNIWKSVNSGVDWDCVAHWVGSSTAASVHADQHWFAYSPVNGYLYVCNDGGIYYSTDGGTTWPELSAGLGIGQLYKIGVSQNTHALVINGYQDNGTAIWDDTLFRTERGGDGMECIIDYSNDDVMYASVYYGNIARSLNNGYSFGSFAAQNTNGITESGAWVTPYLLDKDDPNIMFIGYKNVWRTTTATGGSVSFEAISNSLGGSNSSNMRQLRQSKVDGNRLYAVRSDNKFFRSDNALSSSPTWSDLTSNLPVSGTVRDVETSPFSNNTVWLSINNQIWKSTNAGISWSNITGNLPNIAFLTIVADPFSNNGLYVGGSAGIYYIDNTLSNWVTFFDDFPTNVSVRELEIYHPQGNWEGSRIRAATYGRGLWESDLYNTGNIAPLAFINFSLDSTDICSQDTIQLFNNSAYGIDSSKWTITPSSGVAYVNGTSDTSMNPQIVLSQIGSYDVKLVVINSNGSDSLELTGALKLSAGLDFPWFDNFEDNIMCSASGCQTSCGVNHWKNLTNGSGDDIDWRPDNEGTPWSAANYNGANTGPSVDFNPGTSEGVYLYVSSYPPYTSCYNNLALLESPCISLNEISHPEFKFAYHMFGNNGSFGDLDVDIFSNGSWTNLWTETGNHGDIWLSDSISLNAYLGQSVKLRFAGHSGSGWQADIAIDGIEITAGPMAEFSADDTLPCQGQIVQFIDSSSQNPTSWSWTVLPNSVTYMNGTNSNSQNPQIRFDNEGAYQVILYASNQYDGDFESKSAFINVIVPQVTLTSSAANNVFCLEDTVVMVVEEGGYTNYTFKQNGTIIQSGLDSVTVVASAIAGDQFQVTVVDSNGCSGASENVTIEFFDVPNASIHSSDDDNEFCSGDTILFSTLPSNFMNYNFMNSGVSQQSSASFQWETADLIAGDEVWAMIQDTNGCFGTTDTIINNVLPIPPTPSINAILDSLECSIPAELYRWQYEDSVNTTINQTIAKNENGIYRVRIFEGGCWSLWSDPFIVTGFHNIDNIEIKVYPSPSVDFVYLEFVNGMPNSETEIRLIDMKGSLVYQNSLNVSQAKSRIEIPLKNLPAGVYSILLSMDGSNYAIPIVKERR